MSRYIVLNLGSCLDALVVPSAKARIGIDDVYTVGFDSVPGFNTGDRIWATLAYLVKDKHQVFAYAEALGALLQAGKVRPLYEAAFQAGLIDSEGMVHLPTPGYRSWFDTKGGRWFDPGVDHYSPLSEAWETWEERQTGLAKIESRKKPEA